MAAPPTDTYETYSQVGKKEDISDIIYQTSPEETPFLSAVEDTESNAILHQWQTDTLAAASGSNAVEEGLDASTNAATATVLASNTAQISDKVPRVSGTANAVAKYGRGDELEYQIAKMGKELKRDMETSLLANTAEVTGSSGTARVLGGIETWIGTNTSVGTGGNDQTDGNTVRTAGTARELTETLLKTVLRSIFTEGGNPKTIMVGGFNKQTVSSFTGNATKTIELGGGLRTLDSAIDIYKSDFGTLHVYPNRFQVATSALVLDMDFWKVAFLRQFQVNKLAKTGDSERVQIVCEYTLEACNEKASGAVFDLSTS